MQEALSTVSLTCDKVVRGVGGGNNGPVTIGTYFL